MCSKIILENCNILNMKINNNSFELNEKLTLIIDSSDNDGLIFIPNNIELNVEIEN